MTNEAKQFNELYNLSLSNSSFKKVDQSKKAKLEQIGGKPTTNFKDFLKRFFTKPVYVTSLIIFVALVIIAIVAPLVSQHDAMAPILNKNNTSSGIIKWLPSSGSPVITKTLSSLQYQNFITNGVDKSLFVDLGRDPLSSQHLYKFDVWKVINAYSHHKNINIPPVSSVLGTDDSGYDIWTTTWEGTKRSLAIAVLIAVVTTTIGVVIGSWVGLYVGSMVDIVVMKVLAVYSSIPTVVWYALIAAMLPLGTNYTVWLLIVMLTTGWMRGLGTARMFMWKYVNSEFMMAATATGVSKFGKIFKHALPNYLGIIAYVLVSAIPSIIEAEASLSFLGFSPTSSTASLGQILNNAKNFPEHLTYILFPTIIIFTITISLHFVAIGVNDALDPRYK